jgi:hypothetical protein
MTYLDPRRDFDQHHPPGAGVLFAQGIRLTTTIELATTSPPR